MEIFVSREEEEKEMFRIERDVHEGVILWKCF